MKKLNIAISLALGLVIPYGAMAANTNFESIMEMNEFSTDKVTVNIEIPVVESDQAVSKEKKTYRKTVRDFNSESSGAVIRLAREAPRDHDHGNYYDGDNPRESQGEGGDNNEGKQYAGEGPGESEGPEIPGDRDSKGNHYDGDGPHENQGEGSEKVE